MPIGYKYVERAADSYVNYAEIGKNMSDMLTEENRIREEKKAAIDSASRQYGVELADAPQGEFQDGNKFTTDFVDMMQKQRLMDDKLLKAGKLSLKDYTLRRQNNTDDTKNLFDIQKIYQEKAPEIQRGLADGSLQAFNGFNMANAEGIKDFKNLKAMVDQTTGRINVARTKFNNATGTYEIVNNANNTQPVGVLKGKILQQVPTFMVEETMDKTVKNWAPRVRDIQKLAGEHNLGNVITYTGTAIEEIQDPIVKGVMQKWNDGINKYVDSLLVQPYDLMSVLTENTGNYNAESYTFDRAVADADGSKILLKMNPNNTGLGVIDETGKNFKKQKEEAASWIKSQLNNKIDNTVKAEEGKQVSLNEPQKFAPRDNTGRNDEIKNDEDVAGSWNRLATENTLQGKKDAADAILSSPNAQAAGLLGVDLETKPGSVILTYVDPKKNITKDFKGSTVENWAAKNDFTTTIDRKKLVKYGGAGKTITDLADYKGVKAARKGEDDVVKTDKFDAVANSINPDLFKKKMGTFSTAINPLLQSLGYKAVPQTGNILYNTVDIVDDKGNIVVKDVQTNYAYSEENRNTAYTNLIEKLRTHYQNKNAAPATPAPAPTPAAVNVNLNASDKIAGKTK